MKSIPLTKGQSAIVDDEDYDFLNQWKWCIHSCGYAIRNAKEDEIAAGSPTVIYMHRAISCPDNNERIDHIDGNKLNNTRMNLRLCSSMQNNRNIGTRAKSKSGYKGVSWSENAKMWRACCAGKHIGYYKDPINAALAYNAAAKEKFGEYARLNIT